jgi:hypothetical protein
VTAPTLSAPKAFSATWLAAASVAAGLTLLLSRPLLAATVGWTTPVVIILFVGVLALGVAAPVVDDRAPRRVGAATVVTVLGAGVLVFVAGRLLSGGHPPVPATGLVVGLNTLAAVAEEALFRRVAFAALLPAGPTAAVAGSALLFGLAHVTVYGWWAFPVDVGAGLVLGWQRWASRSWAIPAVTHALADLLVVI